jgi:hypothetical protein
MDSQPQGGPVGLTPQTGQSTLYDPTQATRRLQNQTQYASRTATSAYGAQLSPVADPNQNLVGFKAGFQDAGRVCLGWIMDGTAIANCYRVHVEKGRAPIIATALSGTGSGCFGVSEINTYSPGTSVVLMVHDKLSAAYILGATPHVLDIGTRAYHDYITQASRKRVDDAHKKYIKQPLNGQIIDWSAWRPYDATLANEWGAISTTGLSITMDDFMVKMAVNEFTGVFGFYHDAMLRIGGYQLQTWTGGHERDAYVDQGEYNDYQGYSPYPWEAAGLLKPVENILEYEPSTYQCPTGKPYYAHWENKHEYQQPYHRTQQFFGYLGQGSRLVVQAPPEDLERWTYKKGNTGDAGTVYDSTIASTDGAPQQCTPGADKETNHEDKPPMGLHEDNIAADGRRFMASAKGITIAKRMLLPMPARLKRPEAGDGDDATKEYKAASKLGSGPDHKITGDIATNAPHPNMQRASACLDLHGYLFNYAGLHPFFWHAKDYKVHEQSELQYAEYNHRIPSYGTLKGSMYLPEPTPKQLQIDHRYKQQNFYESESFISLLDDGSVVIGDGYGAEIKMSAGSLILSAPGDVWVKSGRHAQVWSGGDTIVRANRGVDISTTKKSVRIKSEKDVLIMAGNKGQGGGGVLIESRSDMMTYDFEKAGEEVEFGGVVMRTPKSNIVGLAHQIYLRTGGGGSEIEPGTITLDSGKGEADIITKSKGILNYLGEGGYVGNFFGLADAGKPQVAHIFESKYVLLSGVLGVEEHIVAGGGLMCRDYMLCDGPVVGDVMVSPCEGECEKDINEACDQIENYINNVMPNFARQFHKTYFETMWYEEKRAGNTKVMNIMEFSFRTDDQYKAGDFMLYEDRWQQTARLSGDIPDTWTEKPVKSKIAGETYPFPGKDKLTESAVFLTQDLNIVESAGSGLRDKARGQDAQLAEPYQDPKYKRPIPQVINGTYPIVGAD